MRWIAHRIGFLLYKAGDTLMDWAEGVEYMPTVYKVQSDLAEMNREARATRTKRGSPELHPKIKALRPVYKVCPGSLNPNEPEPPAKTGLGS